MKDQWEELWDEIIYAVCEITYGKVTEVNQRIMSAALSNTRDLKGLVQFYMTGKHPDDPEETR